MHPILPDDTVSSPVILSMSSEEPETLFLGCDTRKAILLREEVPSSLVRYTSAQLEKDDTTTGSQKTMDLLRTWLEMCIANHPDCTKYCSQKSSTPPTRVLDVGSKGTADDPKLFVSNGINAPYLALSHCWGKSPIPTTTTANIAERQTGIPFGILPKNFQDAIVVARLLSIRYLWIDSLCIVQDSKQDWDIESARMAAVYKNAVCTLAAAGSADPSGGLFGIRDPRVNRPCWLPIPTENGSEGVETNTQGSFWCQPGLRPNGPLYTRAWVLQEQALSGRMVSFSANRIFWDCLEASRSELKLSSSAVEGPTGEALIKFKRLTAQIDSPSSPEDATSSSPEDATSSSPEDATSSSPEDAISSSPEDATVLPGFKDAGYTTWYDILHSYMDRKVTYNTDRLPAISAVAQEMSQILDDQYYAGIWRGDLIVGLLWCCYSKDWSRIKPPLKYVAPSWSWASIQSGLSCSRDFRAIPEEGDPRSFKGGSSGDSERDYAELEILEINTSPSGPSTFGSLASGSVSLKCWIKFAVLSITSGANNLLETDSGLQIGGFIADEPLRDDMQGRELWCLLAGWHEDFPDMSTCLILLPTGFAVDECRRIGVGGVAEQSWDTVTEMRRVVIV
ncbi:HET-domain-containing protein [Eremomyces bilateralis CBS 781.70]|uniref:HET-domain-containing protein n=1 Tax=Eremomyces bilateralis CBS 781.70 TaxID=1392243 RepID=A0A6G1G1E9_9PEZI|nr:HET-domain-containing protein [Eremomyces bilateralis CBS 781.70]KAF1811629.1 HET-domain-containing protein [Eremomyces bilateralis CBS 781.70]